MTRRSLLWGLSVVYAPAAQEARSEKTITVGDTRVTTIVMEVNANHRGALVYFHPHENEHGSAVVARHAVRETGGRLVEIRCQGEPVITFKVRGTAYSFDPSHMFTDVGLEHSLRHFGPSSRAALDSARGLRDLVINQLGRGKTPIVALHNNSGEGINALSFRKGGVLETRATRVAINPLEKPHNFFLVLDQTLFTRLHHAGFNTVLQSPTAPDDGSLSILCQQRNWPYVNVEASESDIYQQRRMLAALPAAMA